MKALIPVAGYATRLYPLTLDQPKALLKVGDKRMIEHLIGKINEIDEIDEIHIVTNDKFFSHFKEWRDNFDCSKRIMIHNDQTRSEDERLGAVGDIHFGLTRGNIDDDVLVIGGDNLFDLSLKEVHDRFRSCNGSIIASRDLKDKDAVRNKFGVIIPDENNVILSFEEKPANPRSTLAATMIYMFTRSDIRKLKDYIERSAEKIDNAGDMVRILSKSSTIYTYPFESMWIDIGSHEQLKEAREYMKNADNI